MNQPEYMITLSTGTALSADTVLRHAYVRPDDVVFVAGTLIEGIGNQFSDIDVYVISARRPRVRDIRAADHLRVLTVDRKIVDERYAAQAAHADEEVLLVHGETEFDGVKIDVEFKTYDEVMALSNKVSDIFSYAKSHLLLLTIGLSEREKMFLHRLRFCHLIQGHERYRKICAQISYARYNYLLYRWTASDYSIFLDIVGAASTGEWLRAIELARSNALQQTLAYLNLIGVSNFDPKWLLTYLDVAAAVGYVDAALKEKFDDLYCYRGVEPSRSDTLQQYIERSLDYIDLLFWRSREHIARNPLLFSLSGSNALIFDADCKDGAGLYSTLERVYRGKAYGFPALPSRYLLRAFLQNGGTENE